jgi:hypothetical protein
MKVDVGGTQYQHVNAAERPIQTFKDHFVSALATTNSDFSLQLWGRLAPQVKNTLNMLRPLHINPNISAYEAVHGPYIWNRFPLAPPGCKVVIYKSPQAHTSWGSQGTNAWYGGLVFILCGTAFYGSVAKIIFQVFNIAT